jgi:hypothetical protein
MFWNSPKFKKIKFEWYEILEKHGFKDIEKSSQELKQNAPNSYRQSHPLIVENKLEYYLLLGHHIELEPNFDSDIDKFVMECFSEGLSNREIVDELIRIGKKRHRETVRFIRRKYEHRWGICKWSDSQMYCSNHSKAKKARKQKLN